MTILNQADRLINKLEAKYNSEDAKQLLKVLNLIKANPNISQNVKDNYSVITKIFNDNKDILLN